MARLQEYALVLFPAHVYLQHAKYPCPMRGCEENFGKCDVKMDFMTNDLIKNLMEELKQRAGSQDSSPGELPAFDRNVLFRTQSNARIRKPVQKVSGIYIVSRPHWMVVIARLITVFL